ncbi:MAG: AAA family ATPase [Dehalococcoidia bacterium]|nr:AAA family ATPase [Dehalococcoidia bacterium]
MRVAVIGTSGSGKTTFAAELARRLGARHVDLDAINWQADWKDLSLHDPEEFRRRVAAAVAEPAWASCGNYSKVRDIVLGRATHLVWLDYPKPLVMARVLKRSFHRAWTKEELWPATGNRELFARWLDKEHPIRWAWDTYARRKAQYAAMLDDPAIAHLERFRVTRPYEAKALINRLAAAP